MENRVHWIFGYLILMLGSLLFLIAPAANFKAELRGAADFRTVYIGAKCFLNSCNPYNLGDLQREYIQSAGSASRSNQVDFRENLPVYPPNFYPPSTLFWIVPLALLRWKIALVLWLVTSGLSFVTAALLVADLCRPWKSSLPLALLGIFVATSGVLLASAQPSGLAISLCIIGVYSLLKKSMTIVGIVCFALSLTLKPQIGGLVLIYFLLSSGSTRHRAIIILILAGLMSIPGIVWLTHTIGATTWLHSMSVDLYESSLRGGINDPGPTNYWGWPDMTCLQSLIAALVNAPRVYNSLAWIISGVLLIIWTYLSIYIEASWKKDLLAVATMACLSLLPVYHRAYDSRLLILTWPAAALILDEGGIAGALAMLVSVVVIGGFHLQAIRGLLRSFGLLRSPIRILLLLLCPLAALSSGLFYLVCFAQMLGKGRLVQVQTDVDRI